MGEKSRLPDRERSRTVVGFLCGALAAQWRAGFVRPYLARIRSDQRTARIRRPRRKPMVIPPLNPSALPGREARFGSPNPHWHPTVKGSS